MPTPREEDSVHASRPRSTAALALREAGLAGFALAAACLASCLAACNGPSGQPDVETRDSLGITIVENGPIRNLPEAFVISPEPGLDLGGPRGDPEQELHPSSAFHNAARTSDGRYVVISNGALEVFDSDAQYLRTIARPGEGPGEFCAAAYSTEIRSIGEDVVLLSWSDEEFGFPHLTYRALQLNSGGTTQ